MGNVLERFLMRRRTTAQWDAINEILMEGEFGIVLNTSPISFKIGDGIRTWSQLPFVLDNAAVQAAINALAGGYINVQIGVAPPSNISTANVSDEGTYPLYSGLVVTSTDLAAGLVQFRKTGTIWNKFIIPVAGLINYTLKSDFALVKNYTDPLSNIFRVIRDKGFYITDPNNNARLKFDANGLLSVFNSYIAKLSATDANIFSLVTSFLTTTSHQTTTLDVSKALTSPKVNIGGVTLKAVSGYKLIVTDQYGFIKFDIDKQSSGSTAVVDYKPTIQASREFIHVVGQSLGVAEGGPAISKVIPLPYSYKFVGPGFTEAVQDLTQLQPAINNGTFENPVYGLSKMMMESLAYDGFDPATNDYRHYLSVAAEGGKPISDFMEGTPNFEKLMAQIQAFKNIADAENRSSEVIAIIFIQGESNKATSRASYKQSLLTLYEQWDRRTKLIMKQTANVKVFTYQTASADTYEIPLAFTEISKENPDKFYLACPMYMWDYNATDKVHLANGLQYLKMGAYFGHVVKVVTKDKIVWTGLRPKQFFQSGSKFVEVTFNVPKGRLVFDNTLVSDPGNYGFNIKDGSGNEITISSVTIIRSDTIRIVTSVNLLAGYKLTYGLKNGTAGESGRLIGQRGCLRDQQGDTIVFDRDKSPYPLHNYAILFEYIF